jgi:hypothetical protein
MEKLLLDFTALLLQTQNERSAPVLPAGVVRPKAVSTAAIIPARSRRNNHSSSATFDWVSMTFLPR